MDEAERRISLADEFTLSPVSRHFSHLNLPDKIACYSPVNNSKKSPITGGLQNVHTELLSLLLMDSIFRDFFNVYLLLPIHAHQCTVRQSNEGCYFQCFPLDRGSGNRLSVDRMLQWLYSSRLPFFLSSRLYQLCLFTHAFCTNNKFLDFDETVEYSKKQLVLFGEMRTVEGIQKLIRYAGSSVDGVMIQLWLDLQWLRHTDKDHGHSDMMKTILDRYSSPSNKLPERFKTRLVAAVDETGSKSLNSCLLTRRGNFLSSYDILLHNPFVNQTEKENTSLSEYNTDPLFRLQKDIMNVLKNDLCKRYLIYHNCLPNLLHLIDDEKKVCVKIVTEPPDEVDEKDTDENNQKIVTDSVGDQPDYDKSCLDTLQTVNDSHGSLNPVFDASDDVNGEIQRSTLSEGDNHGDDKDGLNKILEADDSYGSERELLAAGRSKSTLPQITENMLSMVEARKRPKTCYPHLHPKIQSQSRLSHKTSGYITMSSPEDRLATPLSTDGRCNIIRSASEPHLNASDIELPTANIRSVSMICLTENVDINVNQIAVDRIRKLATSRKDGTESQMSDFSMSIDVSVDKNIASQADNHFSDTNSPNGRPFTATEGKNDSILNEFQIVPATFKEKGLVNSNPVDGTSLENTLSAKNNLSQQPGDVAGDLGITSSEEGEPKVDKTIIHEQVKTNNTEKTQISLPPLSKNTVALPKFREEVDHNHDHHSSIVLDNEISVAVRRKTKYQDMMQKRRSSSFLRMSPPLMRKNSQLHYGSDQEKKAASDQIIKDKTPESMLLQDKGRFYVALVASDQLAGGPFKNYLTSNNNELLVDYLSLWENIEIVRCLTNEGGRRGACAKSFGGNGFISCHDEWPVKKDDSYHQYHESLRKIKKYQDSWQDFHKRFKLIRDFFSENQIVKPYDTILIKQHADQLTAAGCNDEILALVQDHLVTKLRKEIERYYKFDSSNFYHYLSNHDDNFCLMKKEYRGKTSSFVARSHERNRLFGKPKSRNLIMEAIFSPLSKHLWVAIDICEKMVFPFALRKLSLPLLTLSSMITMKMHIMRKRREKAKDKEKSEIQRDPVVVQNRNDRPKKIKRFNKPAVKKNAVQKLEIFYINWEAKIMEHNQRLSEIFASLKNSSGRSITSLAPPSIDDMFLQDPSLRYFKRFIIRKYKGIEKDHLLNVANFLIAQKELEDKMDCVDFSELSKGVCATFIFCKSSILHEMNLPEKRLKIISKKKSGNPTFMLFMGAVIKEWIYSNVWSNFISTMFHSSDVDYEQFFIAKEITSWKTTGFNKMLCKRLCHFIGKISNFIEFLSVPAQFEDFRDYLINQKIPNCTEEEQRDMRFGKGLTINPNKLPQDLYLLIEIFAYKNLVLTCRQVARDLSLDGTEEQTLFKKVSMIVQSFFDSTIPPRLQVNIPGSLAVDIMLSQKNLHMSYTLFNEVTCYLFQSLLFFWKKYCIIKHAPKSSQKTTMLDNMSGKDIPMPSSVRKKSNQVQISCSDFDRFKFGKGVEIGGFNYSITHGYRETYRAKQLATAPSSLQASRTLKSIHSSRTSCHTSRASLTKTGKPADSERERSHSRRRGLSIPKRERDRLQSMITPGRKATSQLPRMSLPVISSSSVIT